MFSFWKKSRKDSEHNSSSSNKNKNKESIKDRTVSPVLDRKNNLTTQKAEDAESTSNNVGVFVTSSSCSSLLPNVEPPSEFGLRENSTNAVASEVTVLAIPDEKNDSNSETNKMTTTTTSTPALTSNSYASMVNKKSDPPKGASVKPCGHGTTAISQGSWVPRNNAKGASSTPSSPKLELRKYTRTSTGNNLTITGASPSAEILVESLTKASDSGAALLVNGVDSEGENKKNLINQEAKFQSQLNDLSKQLSIRDAEANKLRFQMEELQRDVFAKSAGMDRLEAELQAAHKECEILRQRVRHLETDLEKFRERNSNLVENLSEKTEQQNNYEKETNAKILELEGVIKSLQEKIQLLEEQLDELKKEKDKLEQERIGLVAEREAEKKRVEEILEQASKQKQEIEKKWRDDFEKLRTINIMKEQQLLDDFEWKLREVQQTCKKRLEEKDKKIEDKLQEAYKEAEKKMHEAETMMAEVETLKSYELEIEQLKGLTVDQEKALKEMIEQQDQMKQAEDSLKSEAKRLRNLIEIEKENLQHIQRRHNQEIADKERCLQQTLHQKRTEIAMYWEERLMTECTRLKSELEQIHCEEKHFAMDTVRREKDEEFQKAQTEWECKLKDCLKEITELKMALVEKDEYYHDEIIQAQSNTDRDIMELRRLMDKIDMCHHDRFEKLVQEHDSELERINEETQKRFEEAENSWQNQISSLSNNLELVKEQMEEESQQKIESLIEQHRSELDTQWENLISQKSEAVQLVEEEYVLKYKTLEEQFITQQKSHAAREIELLKAIDSMKNELGSKESALDDLQNNVDVLEGGIQVLNGEIAQQTEQLTRTRRESNQKISGLQETIENLEHQQEHEREAFRLKLMSVQKQSQETIDHLQRKCQCLTKLFEEVRVRYERRESRQEDLNIISDLRQVIAEQEKDLACLNEEKRYFQMRLLSLENNYDENNGGSGDEDAFEDAEQIKNSESPQSGPPNYPPIGLPPAYPIFSAPPTFSIPPTIPECDE